MVKERNKVSYNQKTELPSSVHLFLAQWYPIQNLISALFDQILFSPSVHSSQSEQNNWGQSAQ